MHRHIGSNDRVAVIFLYRVPGEYIVAIGIDTHCPLEDIFQREGARAVLRFGKVPGNRCTLFALADGVGMRFIVDRVFVGTLFIVYA